MQAGGRETARRPADNETRDEAPTPRRETLLSHTTTDPLPSLEIHWPPQLPTSAFSPFDNKPSVDVQLTFKILFACNVFCWSVLTSVILFPMPAPLPLLTSLLGTLLPLPWDSFTVRYQQSASCIPGLNLFLSSRKVKVSLSGCLKYTMNFSFQNGVPFQATRYSAEPLCFHLQNEDPQGSSLPITTSLTSQDSAFVLECTSQSPLPLRSQCHHRQGLAQVADSLPGGFSASHPCPFPVPSADCCCWT